jgi:hypothetical protein
MHHTVRVGSVFLALGALLGGCSLMYDTEGLNAFDPGDPPAPIDETQIGIAAISPLFIYEGVGDGGTRPALLVLEGNDFSLDTAVEITDDQGEPVPQIELASSIAIHRQANLLAVEVLVRAGEGVAPGERPLRVKVRKKGPDGPVEASIPWRLIGLPELDVKTAGQRFDTATNNKLYSRVNIEQPVGVSGNQPLIIRSMSSLRITSNFNLGAAGKTGGPAGGKDGGAPASSGLGFGRGGGGASGTDGGGAGFAEDGYGGPMAAPAVGDPLITSFVENHGSSGGGGGGALIGGLLGESGGGSGGSIELSARGELTIAAIASDGGNGGTSLLGLAGDGGGGSGGAIVIRSGIKATTGLLRALGGLGGNTPATSNRGSVGRIRIDAPAIETGQVTPAAVRGAMFDPDTEQIVEKDTFNFLLHGSAGSKFDIRFLNGANQPLEDVLPVLADFQGAETLPMQLKLKPGFNRLCTTPQGSDGTVSNEESTNCIDVAFILPRPILK